MPKPPIKPKDPTSNANRPDPWTTLQSAITNIFNHQQSNLSLSQLHSEVNYLVAMHQNSQITNGLTKLLKEQFTKWNNELSKVAGNPLLNRFSNFYNDFMVYCSVIPKVFMLYDKYYQEQSPNQSKDSESCRTLRFLFRDYILNESTLIKSTNKIILSEILNARRGSEVDLNNVHNLIQMYYSFHNKAPQLSLFKEFFDLLTKQTTKFYDDFFNTKFDTNNFTSYLTTAQAQYKLEEGILRSILLENEIQEILREVNLCLLLRQEDVFLCGPEPPISTALTASDSRPMKWLVDMYRHFDADLQRVFEACAEFIYNEMLKLSENFKEENKASEITQYVQELINRTEALEKPYKLIFKGIKEADDELQRQIKKAWNSEQFNIIPNFCAYLDQVISSELKTFTPEEREEFPSLFAKFYARTEDRLMFSQLYEKGYVRRYIKMGTKLHGIEGPLITRVQRDAKVSDFAKSFEQFNNKLKDSQNIESEFMNYLALHPNVKKKFNGPFQPLVFDARSFPLDRVKTTRLPAELSDINKEFTAFYIENHPKGKLELLSDVSIVESKLRIPKQTGVKGSKQPKIYTISSDIVCASILNCVAKGTRKRLGDIYDEVGEDKGRIGLYIKRLCQKTCPILDRVEHKDRMLQPDDIFILNPNFTFKSLKVTVQPVENIRKKDMKSAEEPVRMDKSKAIQAAIVRCLKARNRVPLETLNNEVIQMTSQYFRADVKQISKELLYLEGEDYFDRSGDENNPILTYHQ